MVEISGITFGERLRMLRKGMGLTQDKITKMLGLTSRTIRRFEHNSYLPGTKIQIQLATFFGMSVDELMCGDSLTGKAEAIRLLKPYVILHIVEVAEKMQRLKEELLELKCLVILDDYTKDKIWVLEERLKGTMRYSNEAWTTLLKLEC